MSGGAYDLTLPMPPAPMGSWRDRGACKGMNPDIFFPDRGDDARDAKAICAGCEVTAECLDWALTTPEKDGVWGGTTGNQRKPMRLTPLCAHCREVRVRMNGSYCEPCRKAIRRPQLARAQADYKARKRAS